MIGAFYFAGAPVPTILPGNYVPYYFMLPYQTQLSPAFREPCTQPGFSSVEVGAKPQSPEERASRTEPRKKTVGRRKKKGLPKKKVQNPERNVFTNICSQLMSFLLSKQKCGHTIQRIFESKTPEWEQDYYASLRKLKIKFSGYYNMDKVRELWFGSQGDLEGIVPQEFLKIRRILSNVYIETKLIRSLLTSKKLSNKLKIAHMRLRREMRGILRNQDQVATAESG